MQASTETILDQSQEAEKPQSGPTAKEQAMIEERNAALAKAQVDAQQEARPSVQDAPPDERNILGIAAKGRDHLLEQFRAMNEERSKRKPYEPPARTQRQMDTLNEELEAGRRAQQRAEAQQASRPIEKPPVNEGFTTPVYRPGDVVPDPTIPAIGGYVAGTKGFSPDV